MVSNLLKANDAIAQQNRKIFKEIAEEYCKELIRLTRRDNADAVQVLKESGIEIVNPSKDQIAAFEINAQNTYEKSIPDLYSRELFNRVQTIIKDYRKAN